MVRPCRKVMAIRPLIESFDKKPLNAEQIFVGISIYRDRFLAVLTHPGPRGRVKPQSSRRMGPRSGRNIYTSLDRKEIRRKESFAEFTAPAERVLVPL